MFYQKVIFRIFKNILNICSKTVVNLVKCFLNIFLISFNLLDFIYVPEQ